MPARDGIVGVRIAPGVYDDGAGTMIIDANELLESNGYKVTEENVVALLRTLRRRCPDVRIRACGEA